MICVRGKVLKVKGRELALFFPVRWRDGGATEKVVAGGVGGGVMKNISFIRGGSHSSSNPLPVQTYHFDRKEVPFRLVCIKMLRIPFTHQRSSRSPWAPTLISKPLDVVTGKPW